MSDLDCLQRMDLSAYIDRLAGAMSEIRSTSEHIVMQLQKLRTKKRISNVFTEEK